MERAKLQAGPQFTMQWDGEAEGLITSIASMVDANSENEELCDFLRQARFGDEQNFGGGAAPLCTLRRVL